MPEQEDGDLFDAPEPSSLPALHRAHPQDAAGEFLAAPRPGKLQEGLFTDGSWRTVSLLAKMRDRGGGWRVLVRWFDGGGTREEWFLWDHRKFREPIP
jgi:hypothetical protein